MKRQQSASPSMNGNKRSRKIRNSVQAKLVGTFDTSAAVEAVSPFDHVLLEHSATFCGRRLELRVTTANAAHPDQVAVHVCYGDDKAAVTVTAASGQGDVCETMKRDNRHLAMHDKNPGNAAKYLESPSSPTEERGSSTQSVPMGEVSCPAEILEKIISSLSWKQQVGVRRVSRRWRAAADACLGRQRRLHIGQWDFPRVLDDEVLERLLRSMPTLTDLSIHWGLENRKLDIDYLSQHCRLLEVVDLTRFRLDNWSLKELCLSCPRLEVVTLPRMCDDAHVTTLLRHLPHLRQLDLRNNEKVTGESFSQLPVSLERLLLAGCKSLKSASLRHVARCVHLRELDVSDLSGLEGEDVAAVLTACGQLESFYARDCDLPLWCLRQLSRFARLRRLDLQQEVVQDDWAGFADVLADSGRLERLAVQGADMLVGPWVRQVASCSLLRELELVQFYEVMEEDLLVILAGCSLLERLEVSPFYGESPAWVRQLGQCKKLRMLKVWLGCVDEHDVVADSLANLDQLEWLSMAGLCSPSNPIEMLLPPAGLPTLIHLDASDCSYGLDSNSLRRLVRLLPRLRSLNIKECESITEDGLRSYLPRFRELESLNLDGVSSVTDSTLDRLQCCPRLKWLCLGEVSSGVTLEGVRRLVMACPTLEVLWIDDWGGTVQKTTEKLNTLIQRLHLDRSFTLCVCGNILKKMSQLPPGHLLLINADVLPWEDSA